MKKVKLSDIDWGTVKDNITAGLLAVILMPILLPYFLIKETLEKIREKKDDKRKEAQKLSREERMQQPRMWMQHDNQVELFDLMGMSSKELVYVANEECEQLNDLFENHPEVIARWEEITGYRIVYMPAVSVVLQESEVLQYHYPYMKNPSITPSRMTNDYMFQQLVHSEDREMMRHGFLRTGRAYTTCGGWETWFAFYYDLSPESEETLDEQVQRIAKQIKKDTTLGGVFFSVRDTSGDEDECYADNHFVSQKMEEDLHDLMEEVRERILKLRQRGVAEHLLENLLHPDEQLSKLVITKDYRIFLPGYNNMEIKMEPLVKAVYFLFLKHPNGLYFKDLPDYRKELTTIYMRLRSGELTPQMQRSIEDVTNPLMNSINEKCARIRAAFLSRFDNRLACNYYIDGMRAEKKRISLPRRMVVWE